MAKRMTLGIDVGATKIRGVVFDGKKILARAEYKYPRRPVTKRELPLFWSALFGLIDELFSNIPKKQIAGIGVGIPAPIESGRRALRPGNLNAIDGVDIDTPLKKRYRSKIVVTNDVKAAAVAEWKLGAGRKFNSIFMITLGSGIGGGFIKDGRLQAGAFDTAYEVGHMILDADSSLSRKDRKLFITYESLAAEQFFAVRNLSPLEAEKKARAGSKKMRALWKKFGAYVGIGIANVMNLLGPEAVIVGGGMSNAWPLFASEMKKTARKFTLSQVTAKKTKILKAKLANDAGAIGAALLAMG